MTKVPPKAVGARPPRVQPQRPERSRRPRGVEKAEKPKLQKPKGGEAVEAADEANSPQADSTSEQLQTREEIGRALEKRSESFKDDVHLDDREQKAAHDEAHQKAERTEKKDKGFLPKQPGALSDPKKAALQKKPSDGFEQKGVAKKLAMSLDKAEGVTAAVSLSKAVEAAAARPGKPLDAMSLLHSAQEAGVFFNEDGSNPGAEQVDPELAAAVQEAGRLLAEVRGVLRVGPGTNDAGEKVIVVVADRGFGEGSLRQVPPLVHRFATLLALPYDLLPLRRER